MGVRIYSPVSSNLKLKFILLGRFMFQLRPDGSHSLASSARPTTWPAAGWPWRVEVAGWPLSFPHDPVPTISYPLRRFLLPRSRLLPLLSFPAASPRPCSSTRSLSPPRGKEERAGFWVTNAPLGREHHDAHLLRGGLYGPPSMAFLAPPRFKCPPSTRAAVFREPAGGAGSRPGRVNCSVSSTAVVDAERLECLSVGPPPSPHPTLPVTSISVSSGPAVAANFNTARSLGLGHF